MTISSDTVAENAASEVVGTVSVTHSEGQSLTFAVDETKHDGALFTFENNVLKLKATPLNYEEDNLKKVEFTVTDADGETQSYTIDVKVSNVDEAVNAWASGVDLTKTSSAEIGSKRGCLV